MRFETHVHGVIEITLTAARTHGTPYEEVDVDARFQGPDGDTQVVPGFWAGGNTWKVRFAPSVQGEYRFTTQCSVEGDAGLHGQFGVVVAAPYEGDNVFLKRGRIRVAPDGRHFVHADGTPFFWMGDTWWMGLTTRLPWPDGFKSLAADRVAKGFNVIQIIAGPYPDMDAWDERGRNEAGFPFTEGFSSINPSYYDFADTKIQHLVQDGLSPCIVAMWGYYLPQLGLGTVKRFWRYLVARYGAYPVTWCICGEGTMPYYLSKTGEQDTETQRKGWTEVMAHVRQIDGHRNLITIHPTRYGRDQVMDARLMDFEMLQTGHSDLDSVPSTVDAVMLSMPREPRMPVIVAEVNYEGIMGRAWQNVQRLCYYKAVLNGTAGHTYGANGIWQLNEPGKPYGPSPHGRSWGNTPWTEAMHLPGSTQMGYGRKFFERFEWWRLERHPEWLTPMPVAVGPYSLLVAGIPGELRIVYVPLLWDPPVMTGFEAGVTYTATYFDPRSGAEIDLGLVTPGANGRWSPPFPPEVGDWLLVLRRSG